MVSGGLPAGAASDCSLDTAASEEGPAPGAVPTTSPSAAGAARGAYLQRHDGTAAAWSERGGAEQQPVGCG